MENVSFTLINRVFFFRDNYFAGARGHTEILSLCAKTENLSEQTRGMT